MITRPPLPVTLVPDDVLLNQQIGHLAFRLWVLAHAETQAHLLVGYTGDDLAAALGSSRADLDEAARELERAGYLVRKINGSDWQLVR